MQDWVKLDGIKVLEVCIVVTASCNVAGCLHAVELPIGNIAPLCSQCFCFEEANFRLRKGKKRDGIIDEITTKAWDLRL